MPDAFDQSRYQVRLEWGADGLARLAPADVVIVVDVLAETGSAADAVAAGDAPSLDALPAETRAVVAGAGDAVVLLGGLRNAAAVARETLAEQQRRAQRTSIAVVAVGADDAGRTRFAVEDQFGAGAVIDALGALGIDHTSPEAAAACESFRGLRRALRHLLTASGTGQVLLERDRRAEVLAAADVDALEVVPVLRDGAFVAA